MLWFTSCDYYRGGIHEGVENIAEWIDALEKLKESVPEPDDDMGVEVFKVLKYSYNQLKDPKVQQCFLYCSLFPEDYEIDRETLIEHFIDERLVDGLRTRQVELNRGHTILNQLEKVCLLEGGINEFNGRKYVKMHDLVRSMAIQIGRVDFRYLVEAGEQLREIPGEEKWAKDLTKVSLMKNYISDIPSSASRKCPSLSTLMLNGNGPLENIPDFFFSHMPELSVLDLSHTGIEYLPTSISNLVNLTALRLENCKRLKYVPSLENLEALRRLSLRDTDITKVPQGMEMLLNLRYLNLEHTKIEMIPDGIFSKLSCLQYLGIKNEYGRMSIEETRKVRAEEIMKLRKLETFKGELYDMDDFNKYVRWRENNGGPNNYQLILLGLGNELLPPYYFKKDDFERSVILKECKISSKNKLGGDDSDSLAVLPKDVQFLYIEECNDASSLYDVASLNNAIQLSECFIQGCKGMEHVVCCCCSCKLPLIQSLESLTPFNLPELRTLIGREICCASASASASASSSKLLKTPMFSSLQQLWIIGCPNIKRLFMPVLLPNLKNLVELYVSGCENMVEIIGESSDEDENEDDENQEAAVSTTTSIISAPALPKLSHLQLRFLPKLERFCTKEICCASASASASSSKLLLQTPMFSSLNEFTISGCPKLKRLFMPVLLPNLKNLVQLKVQLCENMVEIIGEDEDDENQLEAAVSTTTSIISAPALPKLSDLMLDYLPELKRFCTKEIVFDSLKEIHISECPKMSFNGDRVQHVESGTYSVVNSRIGERIDEEFEDGGTVAS